MKKVSLFIIITALLGIQACNSPNQDNDKINNNHRNNLNTDTAGKTPRTDTAGTINSRTDTTRN